MRDLVFNIDLEWKIFEKSCWVGDVKSNIFCTYISFRLWYLSGRGFEPHYLAADDSFEIIFNIFSYTA